MTLEEEGEYDELVCQDCQDLLYWDGEVPDSDWEVLCYECALKRMETRLEVLEEFRANCEKLARNGDKGDLMSYVLECVEESA